jgi:hypothetical protein
MRRDSLFIPEQRHVGPDTPLRLQVAAALAYPDVIISLSSCPDSERAVGDLRDSYQTKLSVSHCALDHFPFMRRHA